MADDPAPARDATWDIARGIGMILVIYAHFLEPIYPARPDLGRLLVTSAFAQWQAIYSFHMMLFFLVSGAVNRNLPNKPWPEVVRSSLRLLALAWVVHIVGTVVSLAVADASDALPSFRAGATSLLLPIFEGYYWSVGVLWFLTSLCFVQLLAYFLMRRFSTVTIAVAAALATAAVVYYNAPNEFIFRSWMPGLCFFALGCSLSQWGRRLPAWLCMPLLAAGVLLAPLNSGCSFSLTGPCEQQGAPFGVRMFAGSYGYLPLFFLSSLLGSLCIVTLSAGLARRRMSKFLSYIGKNSLELFIINGFVATFLPSYVAQIRWPTGSFLFYPVIAVIVVALHLAALKILRPALRWIDLAARIIAEWLVRLVRAPFGWPWDDARPVKK